MLARKFGGMPHAFVGYCEALRSEGHRVTAVIRRGAEVTPALERLGIPVDRLGSTGTRHPWAQWKCRRILRHRRPSVVFAHGKRAVEMFLRAGRGSRIPIVARTPNYNIEHLIGLDHVLSTTSALRQAVIAAGQPEDRVSVVPNFVRVPRNAVPAKNHDAAPVIGGLGRFVERKGFATFIEALALLRQRGHAFRALLGGGGPLGQELRALSRRLGLEGTLSFTGWVDDKKAFYNRLTALCVPSLEEAFGIVLIEGFAHGVPTVVTATPGPLEIARDAETALIVAPADAEATAAALARLLEDPDLRRRLATAALAHVRAEYDLPVVARRVSEIFRRIAARGRGEA
jgi:glycosyltransferase involved in cell wall biosynthesis